MSKGSSFRLLQDEIDQSEKTSHTIVRMLRAFLNRSLSELNTIVSVLGVKWSCLRVCSSVSTIKPPKTDQNFLPILEIRLHER